MAAKIHGRLGAQALSATTDTAIYTVPAGRKATVIVNACNRVATDTTWRLAHCDGAIGTLATDYLEYDSPLPASGVIERDKITMAAGDTIVARAGASGVSVSVRGIEEDA